MSIFSRISKSKKAAQEAKGKAAEKEQKEEAVVKAPYKHIPTHAAVDALSGAPSTWKADDRAKIREHHKRRSQMVISRTGSSLSTVSYMNSAAGPSHQEQPQFPRNSSYSSYNPAWFDQREQGSYLGDAPAQKRYKMSRGHSHHDSGIGASIGPSPLASNLQSEEASPVVSSGNSTSSNSSDPLEIASNRKSQRPQPNVYAERDIFTRLHTSTTRKLGEAPISEESSPVETIPHDILLKKKEREQEQKQIQKKSRWSIMGKKNPPPIAV